MFNQMQKPIALVALMVLAISVQAEQALSGPLLLAGEIIVGGSETRSVEKPVKKQGKKADKAGAVSSDEDDGEGVLSPRSGAPAEQREYEGRQREKAKKQTEEQAVSSPALLLQAPTQTVIQVLPDGTPAGMNANQQRAGELRDKARIYGKKQPVHPTSPPPPQYELKK